VSARPAPQPTADRRQPRPLPALAQQINSDSAKERLDDTRHSAAIIYAPDGPHIVVVLTYRPGESQTQAAAFGKIVLRQALAPR
jgi:hypothetical protein